MLMVHRLQLMLRQAGVDLRPRAVHYHQPDAETVQQPDVVDDAGEVLMLNGFAAQHDDKGFTSVGIDIGNGMTKTLNQCGATFLHGKPSLHDYSIFLYFYSLRRRVQVAFTGGYHLLQTANKVNRLHFMAFSG